jgi:hypothetical protein
VTQKGTSNSVVTGDDGSFSINILAEDATLVITSIGFTQFEVSVNKNSSTLSVVLKRK